jgi:hypothetical protein
MDNLKNIVTNIVGVGYALYELVMQGYDVINGQQLNWKTILVAVVIGVVSYFTGKNPDGSVSK